MADKTIGELPAATQVNADDLFILEQSSTAKKLTGQTLESWLLSLADGHGGIQSISKTGTSGLVDTYTITYADGDTSSFAVTNGAKGDTGASTTLYIKYANAQPLADTDMSDIPDKWIGLAVSAGSSAPSSHSAYTWYRWKSEEGDAGAYITGIRRTSGTGAAGTTDTYTVDLSNGQAAGTFNVYNGADGAGTGTVKSINNITPGANGNLTLAAEDFGAISLSTFGTTDVSVEVTVEGNSVGLAGGSAAVTPGSFVCVGAVGVSQDLSSCGKVVLCSYYVSDNGAGTILASVTAANLTSSSVTATFTLKCLRILQYT